MFCHTLYTVGWMTATDPNVFQFCNKENGNEGDLSGLLPQTAWKPSVLLIEVERPGGELFSERKENMVHLENKQSRQGDRVEGVRKDKGERGPEKEASARQECPRS